MFINRLHHDLVDAGLPLPPQTKVNFTLQRAPDAFVLMVGKKFTDPVVDDNEKYKLSLLNISLYVPVGVLSDPMYKSIIGRWPTEPIVYHYRPTSITCTNIALGTSEWISDSLFPVGV